VIPLFNIRKIEQSAKANAHQVHFSSNWHDVEFSFASFTKDPINAIVFRNFFQDQKNREKWEKMADDLGLRVGDVDVLMGKEPKVRLKLQKQTDDIKDDLWIQYDVEPFLRELYRAVRNYSFQCSSEDPVGESLEVGLSYRQDLGSLSRQEDLGDCFEAAGRYITEHFDPDLLLVHGEVLGRGSVHGVWFGHAWIEKGDMVIDVSNGLRVEMPKVVYYALGTIDQPYYELGKMNPPRNNVVKYNRRQALEKIGLHKTWGPWDLNTER